jgi:hypothetical protein
MGRRWGGPFRFGGAEVRRINPVSLGNALIWAAAIIATALLVRGTENAGMVVVILGGAAGASVLLVSGALRKE